MTTPEQIADSKCRRHRIWIYILLILYIGLPVLMLYVHRDSANSFASTEPTSTQPALDDLAISGPNGRWRKWNGSEVIKFSFEQLDTAITLVLGAAVAIIGAVAKVAVDSILGDPEKRRPLSRTQVCFATAICAFCGWSILAGVLAKSYFPRLADAARFSIYQDLGVFAFHQIGWFLVALALLVFALLREAWNNAK